MVIFDLVKNDQNWSFLTLCQIWPGLFTGVGEIFRYFSEFRFSWTRFFFTGIGENLGIFARPSKMDLFEGPFLEVWKWLAPVKMSLKRDIFTGVKMIGLIFTEVSYPVLPLGEDRDGRTRKNEVPFLETSFFLVPIFTGAGQFWV